MERSSNDLYTQFGEERNTNETQALAGEVRTCSGLQEPCGEVQVPERFEKMGGRTLRNRRSRDAIQDTFGWTEDLSDNTYTPYEEEEDDEREETRGHSQGRGRGRSPGRGRGRGRGYGRGRGSFSEGGIARPGIGNSSATSKPGIGTSYATDVTGIRPGTDISFGAEIVERPEIDNSRATINGVGGYGSLERPQMNEGGIRSGNIVSIENIDMLKCSICFKTFCIPIFECVNGHTACSTCYYRVQNTCPSCRSIGYTCSRVLEELLKAIKITCFNSKYGCQETVSYTMKRELHEHQQSCTYEPCHCPLPGCGFNGSCRDLYLHFARMHSASAIRFTFDSSFPVHISANTKYKFLQEAEDHTLFILNYGVDALGNVADVICVGSRSTKNEYSYDLEAGNVQRSARVTSVTHSLPRWTGGLAPKPILVVTKDLIDSSWDHKIQVCIRSKTEN